jgi:hypothetical protein
VWKLKLALCLAPVVLAGIFGGISAAFSMFLLVGFLCGLGVLLFPGHSKNSNQIAISKSSDLDGLGELVAAKRGKPDPTMPNWKD